jgi:hypothetical protein
LPANPERVPIPAPNDEFRIRETLDPKRALLEAPRAEWPVRDEAIVEFAKELAPKCAPEPAAARPFPACEPSKLEITREDEIADDPPRAEFA